LSPPHRAAWRAAQILVWAAGTALWVTLLARPAIGVAILWNVVIPVAPALLVFAPGLWRNICPLATTALAARHAGLSSRRRLSISSQGWLAAAGVAALYLIVPLRHVVLNTDGLAAAWTLAGLASASFLMGLRYEWKSGWCSGLCPVHPVERLYGTRPALTLPNAHCSACAHCTAPCPESTPAMHPLFASGSWARRVSAVCLVGGFPGFVWGWFHLPDFPAADRWDHVLDAYGFPLAGLAATLTLFLVLWRLLPRSRESLLVRTFAAAAVGCYYWYRIPALFGLGLYPGDGMLVDLSGVLPASFPALARAASSALLAAWLVLGERRARSWTRRPPFLVLEEATPEPLPCPARAAVRLRGEGA
jgi:hypothetical protein